MKNKKPLTIITAPSCAGKDYLFKCLFQQFPGLFEMAISSTTRPPREGEVDGKDYNFLSLSEFKQMEADNRLLESVKFGDKCYGTSASEIERIQAEGKFPVLIVEPVGAINIWNWCKKNEQSAQFAFIDVDRNIALSRFIDRFLNDYQHLLKRSEDAFLEHDGDQELNLDKELNGLISNYSKRIYLSMYQESGWSKILPYTLRLGKMLEPNDSKVAAMKIKESAEQIEQGVQPGIPDQLLSTNISNSVKKPSSLYDMELVIRKALATIKYDTVNSELIKGIILKCESERLNQMEIKI